MTITARTFVSILAVVAVVSAAPLTAHSMGSKPKPHKEHPGHEHPGEHPGHEGSGTEHPGKAITATDIKAAMMTHIEKKTKNQKPFVIKDKKLKKTWRLNFVKIHDPVRMIDDKTYFACTDFKSTSSSDVLDLDFWLVPTSSGKLKVVEEKIHKVNGKPRFTYEGNKLVVIPEKAAHHEHPGKEHPGKEGSGTEHPGKKKSGKEHPGKEHPGKEHPGEEHPGTKK